MGLKYHVLPCGSVVSVEEQARNESDRPLSGVTLRDADGNVRSLASVLLRENGLPIRRSKSKVIRVQGRPPRQ